MNLHSPQLASALLCGVVWLERGETIEKCPCLIQFVSYFETSVTINIFYIWLSPEVKIICHIDTREAEQLLLQNHQAAELGTRSRGPTKPLRSHQTKTSTSLMASSIFQFSVQFFVHYLYLYFI